MIRLCPVPWCAVLTPLVLPLLAPGALASAPAAGMSAVAPPVVVSMEVDLRDEIAAGRFDPTRDGVGVRGSQAPLSWQLPVPARPLGDGRYRVELRFERVPHGGQPVQYKFRIERPGQVADAGWETGRNHALWLEAPRPRVARAFNAPAPVVPPHRAGTIERLGTVASKYIAPRAVQVWLPPDYAADSSRRYAVLYLNDGQNVFDADAAGAEWQVDEAAQQLALDGVIDAPIIVAVDSVAERIADYTPTAATLGSDRSGSGRPQRSGGGAAAYARFLIDELKPIIDRRYRTRPERLSTAVGGSSLGGLVSLWLALHEGATFGAALVVSPSAWWDNEFARRDVAAWTGADARPRLWLDVGAWEGDEAAPAVRRLRDALRTRGWRDADLSYAEAADGSHDEASWSARVPGMLQFLYGRTKTAHRSDPVPSTPRRTP